MPDCPAYKECFWASTGGCVTPCDPPENLLDLRDKRCTSNAVYGVVHTPHAWAWNADPGEPTYWCQGWWYLDDPLLDREGPPSRP